MENKIERAVILCENNIITVSDLDLETITPYEENSDDIQLSSVEKAAVEKAIRPKPAAKMGGLER